LNKIDILIATHNGEKYLAEQLNSLLEQTYQNWQAIIHDDNSTDNTSHILRDYASRYPEKFYLIDDNTSFRCPKENFSHLMHFSKSDYLMFCDQDDVWLPNKVELTLLKMLEVEKKQKSRPIIVHSDLKIVDHNLKVIAESMSEFQKIPTNLNTLEQILAKSSVTGCTMMLNKKAKEVSMPIHKLSIMHDWWVAAKVLQNKGEIAYINIPLVLYRQHHSNSVGAKKINILTCLTRILRLRQSLKSFYYGWKQASAIDPNINIYSFSKLKCLLYIQCTLNKKRLD